MQIPKDPDPLQNFDIKSLKNAHFKDQGLQVHDVHKDIFTYKILNHRIHMVQLPSTRR